MAYVFAVTWFISTAIAAHLPELLMASGATLTAAVGIAAFKRLASIEGEPLRHAPLDKRIEGTVMRAN